MSKLGCDCGDLICDNTDKLPYKGYLFADNEFFDLFEAVSQDIVGFIAAKLAGTERQWLADYLGNSTTMTDHELARTIISRHLLHPAMLVYQCQKCGRVHIQHRGRSQWFERFSPERNPHWDIFHEGDY